MNMIYFKGFLTGLLILFAINICQAQVADTVLNQPVNKSTTVVATHSIRLEPGFSVNGANGNFSASIIVAPLVNCTPGTVNLSQNQNYVMTITPRVAIEDAATFSGYSICDLIESVQYFDGLGRPSQIVKIRGNADATKDLIQPVGYDEFGRESKKYLPYVDGNGAVGTYRSDALQPGLGQSSFYDHPSTGIIAVSGAFAETSFENSSLNRVLGQGAPGAAWQLSAGRINRTDYAVNADNDVYSYEAVLGTTTGEEYKSTLSSALGYYGAGYLYLTIAKDENWVSSNGKTGTTEEYKDKEDKIVLKRIYDADGKKLSTYYVYDYRGNLSFVLPPGANPDAGDVSQIVLDNFCYQYRYDGRSRLIEKKIPGKDWEYFVYNMHDQIVMNQDQEQRNNNKWLFTKYDLLGRSIITGLCNSSDGRNAQQTILNQQTSLGESPDGGSTGYTDNTYPTQTILDHYLTITYYDGYTWPGSSTLPASVAYSTGLYNQVTGTKIYTVDGVSSYLTANYYDIEGRVVEKVAQNHLGGTDRLVNNYNFSGDLLNSTRTHTANTLTTVAVNSYVYDHMGRRRQELLKINSGPNVVLSQIDFNDIGQPITRHLHSADNGASFLQDLKYTYNERGWLRTTNADNASGTNKLFSEELRYNMPDPGIVPGFNGNIVQMLYFGTKGGSQAFNYTYDPLNRLVAAKSTDAALDETIAYDNTGNIISLQRTGPSAATLVYNYADVNNNLSNQLQTVTNNGGAFRTYTYDGNGNAKSDGGDKTIAYNILNLPKTITQNGVSIASYVYDATGNKLKNTGSDGTLDYVNGFVYKNNVLSFIITEEGRVVRNSSDGNFDYEYNIQDHLGNVRVSFDKGSDGNARVIQEDQYYSFGLRKPGGYDFSNDNRYLYNGKELQTDLSNQYDYGARFYDPVVARWNVVDPMAELDRRTSPYAYGFDDPIRHTDPDGMFGEDFLDEDNDQDGPGKGAKIATGVAITTSPKVLSGFWEGIKDFGAELLPPVEVSVSAAAGAVFGTVGLVFMPMDAGSGSDRPPRPILPPPPFIPPNVHTQNQASATSPKATSTKKENRRADAEHTSNRQEKNRTKHEEARSRKDKEQAKADEKYSNTKSKKTDQKSKNQKKKENPKYKRAGPKRIIR